QLDYDDSAWSSGPARFGYGDLTVATTVSFGPDPTNRYPTTYFRHSFVVPEGIAVTNLNLRLARVDGVLVWLNAQESFRTNLPAGRIVSTNLAARATGGEAASIFYPTNLPVAPLPTGTNQLAVEVHLRTVNRVAMGVDLELIG